MTNNISTFTQRQVPEYLRDSSPLFTGFLETYYKYAQLRNNSVGIVQNHDNNLDIDSTLDEYVSKFYQAYGSSLPKELALDKRNFLKLLNSIYIAKGTEKAFSLLFRALFNESISVLSPSSQMLRASDGVWERESFFTAKTLFGNITEGVNTIEFENSTGSYIVKTSRIEKLTQTDTRFYYTSLSKINITDDQKFYIKDEAGENLYVGGLVKSPNKIRIVNPGNSWQIGQVVIIPGTYKNTIARVTAIDDAGGVSSVEILEFGYNHDYNQANLISPYPNKPIDSVVSTTSTLVSINPSVYNHTITINDYTDGVYENIIGITDGVTQGSYFLELYNTQNYTGTVVFAESQSSGSAITTASSSDLSIEDWVSSRALFSYEHANVTNAKGSYKSESGHISNQSVRIQDNYYYQAFSYVVESTRDISEFRNVLRTIHPAGMKMFSNISKAFDYPLDISVSRTLSFDTMYLLDIIGATETNYINFSKSVLGDSATASLLSQTKHYYKNLLTDSVATSALETFAKLTTKSLSSSVATTGDSEVFNVTKILNSNAVPTHLSLGKDFIKSTILDSATASSGVLNKVSNKYITNDSVTVVSNSTTSISATYYVAGDYFAGNYTAPSIQLTIG